MTTHSMHSTPGTLGDDISRVQDKATDGLRSGRAAVADAIDSAATRVSAGGDHVAEAAHATADRLGSGATWLRDTSGQDLMHHVREMVKEHPGRTLLGAALVGYLAGRMLRGD